ncbi:MAG: transcription elongation factor GreB [Myxococcales bacterium]
MSTQALTGRDVEKREYITDEGYRKLREELDHLFRVERPKVVKGVADAAAEGDRSENAEYIYGKKKLREIDKRIEFLTKRVDVLTVVTEYPPQGTTKIFFGAWVDLYDEEEDKQVRYRIVGADESDAQRGYISIESPVARALMGKVVGANVSVFRPKGEVTYEVLAVNYRDPS